MSEYKIECRINGNAANVDQIPTSVQTLRNYFNTHVTKTYNWRKTQLEAVLRMINEHEKAWEDALKADLGKPQFEASFTEIVTTATSIKETLAHLKEWMKPTSVPTPLALLPGSSYIVKEPFGTTLLIAPFNYPLQLTAALSAGNTVVLKPSELTPATTSLLAKLLPKYLDTRAVTVVEGGIPETNALLKIKFDYIFFTGSEVVGKIVLKAAAEFLTPCTLELGGKSPVIVHEDADIDLAARRVMWGKCMNAGQSCIAPDYVYVHKNVKQALLKALQKQITTFYGKDPAKSGDYGRIINERHVGRLKSILDAHKKDIVCGGEVEVSSKYIAPTVLSDVKVDSKVMQEEIFGPILPLLEYSDVNTVLDYVNSRPKPLALYIFSNSKSFQDDVVNRTSSGGVSINDVMMHFANSELPFGGVGMSGLGAYHGKYSFDTFSHSKPVLNKSIYGDSSARYPPYTAFNAKLFRYVAEIYRVNSESFKKVFKVLFYPMVAAVIANQLGLTITWKSNL